MLTAQALLEQITEDGTGIDMGSRFGGPDGWPPVETIPKAEMTEELGESILAELKNNPKFAFNNAVETKADLGDLISPNPLALPPTPGGFS